MKRRLLSLVLALAMVISLLPAVSIAGAEAVEQELASVAHKYAAPSAQGGTYTYDSATNVLKVTGMQTRRYETVGNHAPYAVIPFTANATGTYNIQLKTSVAAPTSAAVNVYIITEAEAEENISIVNAAHAGYGSHASSVIGTKTKLA